ncbi:MAG TPA: hypothetical protein VNL18_10570 [Gemmatimonadales bacterium]|nr:hypothetical protein [Gemmatimonadales bacterium]
MPSNKDFKRVVRARMRKTGESYTTARAQLLKKQPDVSPLQPAPAEYARLAGMSDEAVKAKTGCTWERWVAALDYVKAHTWPHRALAEYVHEKYKVPDWWAQTVTVGYERIKGLREIGQRRGGSYEASKSKTFPVSVTKLFKAFSDKRTREKWLNGAPLAIRTATPSRSMRITWGDGTSVQLWFTAKDRKKSQVAVQHTTLQDRDAASRMKAYWEERLGVLGELLSASGK